MTEVLSLLRDTTWLGMSLYRLAIAFLLILAGLVARRMLGTVALRGLARLTRRTRTDLDDLLLAAARPPLEAGVVLAGIALGTSILTIPTEPVNARRFVFALVTVAVTALATWLAFRLIDAFGQHFGNLAQRTESRVDDALIPLARKALKVFLGILAFVVAVQNLGYSVASILAGLGIGGLALALAAQDTVANFFGSLMILLDRPFRVGDWVRGSGFEGIVEEIGFRSTRVRTFPKTLVSVPNKEIANMVIDNHQAMPVRRIQMLIGVTYGTSAARIRRACEGIRAIIAELPGIWPEGTLVRFHDFGAYSLNIQVRCFTIATDYDGHTRVREELHLKIMDLFEAEGLEFAFPSQTIYYGGGEVLKLESLPGPRPNPGGERLGTPLGE